MMGMVRKAMAVSQSFEISRKENVARALAAVQLPEKMQYQSWHRQQKEETQFTPDVHIIEKRSGQLFFFYDNFQEYGSLFSDLQNEGVQPLCTAFTSQLFQVRSKLVGDPTLDRVVAVEPTKKVEVLPWCDPPKDVPAHVKGELMLAPSGLTYFLDNFMENGKVYQRTRAMIRVPYRMRTGSTTTQMRMWHVKAWMYVGKPDYWGPLFDAGYTTKPLPTFEPNNSQWPRYYAHRTGVKSNK